MSSSLDFFRQQLPAVFPGKYLDQLTNQALRWKTIQNKRSRREIPLTCFEKVSPRKVLILREPFLAWLEETMPSSLSSH